MALTWTELPVAAGTLITATQHNELRLNIDSLRGYFQLYLSSIQFPYVEPIAAGTIDKAVDWNETRTALVQAYAQDYCHVDFGAEYATNLVGDYQGAHNGTFDRGDHSAVEMTDCAMFDVYSPQSCGGDYYYDFSDDFLYNYNFVMYNDNFPECPSVDTTVKGSGYVAPCTGEHVYILPLPYAPFPPSPSCIWQECPDNCTSVDESVLVKTSPDCTTVSHPVRLCGAVGAGFQLFK